MTTTALRRWYPAVVFLVAVVVLMPKALAGQATYLAVDMSESASPYRETLDREPDVTSPVQTDQQEGTPLTLKFIDSLVHGDLQLWEPRVAGGTPLVTTYPWLASPFNVTYALLPDSYAATLHAALPLLIGQLFMFLLLRRFGVGVPAATFGAVAYAFTGANLVFLQRIGVVWILPGLLWAIHRAVGKPTLNRLAVVGLLVAWCWFEGFPAAFAYSVYVAALWAVWLCYRRLARGRRERGQPPLRDEVKRLAKVGGAFAWGAAIAAVTLIPFLLEVTSRGALDLRTTDLNSHLPTEYVWSLFDLSINGDPLDPNDWWAGVNPFESVTVIGSIVLGAALIGLLPGVSRRVRLAAEGRDAWPFFAVIAPAVTFVVFVGTHLLGALYLIPGIASNPIGRARFLIPLGLCVLAALHLDSVLSKRSERDEGIPSRVALAVLAVWVLIGVIAAGDVLGAFDDADRTTDFLESLGIGILFAAGAAAVVVLSTRVRWLAPGVAAVLLAALVFVQVAWPLRNFTPQSPVEDFYPDTEGARTLERLSDDRYRFAASDFNYYPNAAQLTNLYDLRGIALYDEPMRSLLESASPSTFARDPLKQVLSRDEWQLGAPAYDHLALRYFALATRDEPYGERLVVDEDWSGWIQAPLEFSLNVPEGRELAGIALPLAARGDCDSAAVSLSLYEGERLLDEAARPAYDAAAGWVPLALVGRRAESRELRVAVEVDDDGCVLEAGLADDERIAHWMYLEDPQDAVRLAATEQSWIYERPTAWPLVSAHTDWRWFADQQSALSALQNQEEDERDVAYVIGDGPEGAGGSPAEIEDLTIGDDSVEAIVRAADETLLVLAQDHATGWKATVDGEEAPIESVDGALMGVFVEPGEHRVRFEYLPTSLVLGAGVTALATVGALLAFAVARRRG